MSDKSSNMASSQDRDPKIFPDELQGLHDTIITCLNLTNDFLCFGTDVRFYSNRKTLILLIMISGWSFDTFLFGTLEFGDSTSTHGWHQKYFH